MAVTATHCQTVVMCDDSNPDRYCQIQVPDNHAAATGAAACAAAFGATCASCEDHDGDAFACGDVGVDVFPVICSCN